MDVPYYFSHVVSELEKLLGGKLLGGKLLGEPLGVVCGKALGVLEVGKALGGVPLDGNPLDAPLDGKLELKRSGQVNEMDMKEEEMADDLDSDNPLHGYMDIITMDRIVTPAISPEGQVMGKASWLKCLKEYGRCPITHKQIHPEELVVLTRTNFHKFNKLHRITKRLRKYEE